MNGDETVHPLECGLDKDGDKNYHYTGLTKREYFASQALKGLLSKPYDDPKMKNVINAVKYADLLIEELNK